MASCMPPCGGAGAGGRRARGRRRALHSHGPLGHEPGPAGAAARHRAGAARIGPIPAPFLVQNGLVLETYSEQACCVGSWAVGLQVMQRGTFNTTGLSAMSLCRAADLRHVQLAAGMRMRRLTMSMMRSMQLSIATMQALRVSVACERPCIWIVQ